MNNKKQMEEIELSVIIITYNEERYIQRILSALASQTEKNFEVIVVDSNSTDNTEERALKFKHYFKEFRFYQLDCTRGPAFGRNRGAELAKYNRLLFLDADTDLEIDFIEKALYQIKSQEVDLASCPVKIMEKSWLSDFGAGFLNFFMKMLKPVYSAGYGACIFSTKAVHYAVSGFDEDLGICEDCNYIKKARRLYNYNYKILKPYFYTSDRRAQTKPGIKFLTDYIKIHTYRMFTGKEIKKEEIDYCYGNLEQTKVLQ